jgi:hypothetical protein
MSNSFRVRITFGDVTNDNLFVSSLSKNRYRLEEAPLLTESVFYGDIIEAERQSDGSLLFTQVLERSGMWHYEYILPRSIFESDGFKKLLDRIVEAGGHWTQTFGGVLLVSLPKESELNMAQEIENLRS